MTRGPLDHSRRPPDTNFTAWVTRCSSSLSVRAGSAIRKEPQAITAIRALEWLSVAHFSGLLRNHPTSGHTLFLSMDLASPTRPLSPWRLTASIRATAAGLPGKT